MFFQGQENAQFCCQQFFLTRRNSLAVSIIRTDRLRIRHLLVGCKKYMAKNKDKKFGVNKY